jgi:hypothetical protein
MDPDAARRARRKAITADLLQAYEDEEASPPEWLDLMVDIDARIPELRAEAASAVERFRTEPDVRVALRRRERDEQRLRESVTELNTRVRRLNLIAPHDRFHRAGLDAEGLIRPLYRTPRAVSDASSS